MLSAPQLVKKRKKYTTTEKKLVWMDILDVLQQKDDETHVVAQYSCIITFFVGTP